MFAPFVALKKGWSIYFSNDVKFAGMGLALVYMTVLGFDNISTGTSSTVWVIAVLLLRLGSLPDLANSGFAVFKFILRVFNSNFYAKLN